MRPAHALATRAVTAAALAGCGAQTQSSAEDVQGAEREVAQLVDDLQEAGTQGDAEEICGRILATELLNSIREGDSDCVEEMDKALADANDFELQVLDVSISGTTARAQVRQGDDGRTGTLAFERDGDSWRVTSFGS